MKKILYLLILTCHIGFSQQTVDLNNSSVKWTGNQISGKSHFGTLSFESAKLSFTNNDFNGGEFVVDMSSISVDDLTGKGKKSLEGHLMSDDFFSVNKFKTSKLELKKVVKAGPSEYNAMGNLTIKGKTHTADIKFTINRDNNSMIAKLVFDRSKYDVRYGSGSFFENLGDRLILDDIELEVTIKMM